MSEVASVEVASAIVVDGQVVLPGQVVEVPPGDARMLVAQGKVVLAGSDVARGSAGDHVDKSVSPASTDAVKQEGGQEGVMDAAEADGTVSEAPPAGRARRKRG